MDWVFQSDTTAHDERELRQILLNNRSIDDPSSFFNPPHPMKLSLSAVGLDAMAVQKAVARINTALQNQEDVLIFGDYDADGICATAVMWQTLYGLGVKARPFIPLRDKHGYGVTIAALQDIFAQKKPALIITVDNGIVAHEALQYLRTEGIDVILTDHHQPESTLPPATVIVHSTQLCGTTVAWMLCRELLAAHGNSEQAAGHLDLCAIATIADQVPLQAANRAFAWHGLKTLEKTQNPGLRALLRATQLEGKPLTSYSVGFVIAPRLNAMGRLAHALDALRLLCTKSERNAAQLVSILSETNVERQDLTQSLLEDALLQAEDQLDERIVIVHSAQYHEGVIGLIAGRLVEKYHKPAIVLSVTETSAKASARSVPGVNIVELIRVVRDDLTSVGGHPMAAGFGLLRTKLETVQSRLHSLAREQISLELLRPVIELECRLPAALCTPETIALLETFSPFGAANARPVFAVEQQVILTIQTMGREQEHLKLVVGQPGSTDPQVAGQKLEVIGWRHAAKAGELKAGQVINLAVSLELNEWKGKAKVQLVMRDLLVV